MRPGWNLRGDFLISALLEVSVIFLTQLCAAPPLRPDLIFFRAIGGFFSPLRSSPSALRSRSVKRS